MLSHVLGKLCIAIRLSLLCDCNEIADTLTNMGSSVILMGPEPILSLSRSVVNQCIRDFHKQKYIKQWETLNSCRQARELVAGPKSKFTSKLLEYPRGTIKQVVGILTGHNLLNYHMKNMKQRTSNLCDHCKEEPETSAHFLLKCPKWAAKRLLYFGSPSISIEDAKTLSIGQIVSYLKGTKRL